MNFVIVFVAVVGIGAIAGALGEIAVSITKLAVALDTICTHGLHLRNYPGGAIQVRIGSEGKD